jgi:hypothetical protein
MGRQHSRNERRCQIYVEPGKGGRSSCARLTLFLPFWQKNIRRPKRFASLHFDLRGTAAIPRNPAGHTIGNYAGMSEVIEILDQ